MKKILGAAIVALFVNLAHADYNVVTDVLGGGKVSPGDTDQLDFVIALNGGFIISPFIGGGGGTQWDLISFDLTSTPGFFSSVAVNGGSTLKPGSLGNGQYDLYVDWLVNPLVAGGSDGIMTLAINVLDPDGISHHVTQDASFSVQSVAAPEPPQIVAVGSLVVVASVIGLYRRFRKKHC